LTPLAIEAFKSQMLISGSGPSVPKRQNPSGHHKNLKAAWRKTLKRAEFSTSGLYLRSTYATPAQCRRCRRRVVTQLLRQGDAKSSEVFADEMQMKREALEKMNRQANEMPVDSGTGTIQ